jgi:short chain dehydrogenase
MRMAILPRHQLIARVKGYQPFDCPRQRLSTLKDCARPNGGHLSVIQTLSINSWDLKGKRALVTGGSKGIGKAIVSEFLALGAEVLFTARQAGEIAAVEQEFRQMGYLVHFHAAGGKRTCGCQKFGSYYHRYTAASRGSTRRSRRGGSLPGNG